MNGTLKHWIALLLLLTGMAACQQKDETPPQPAKVVTEIISPADGSTVRQGETVNIRIKVSYVSQLHGYELKITDKTTGSTLFKKEDHAHGDAFEIDEQWPDTLTGTHDLKLEINTIIDHDGNNATKEISFKSQP